MEKPSFTDYLSAVNDSSAKIKDYFSIITFLPFHATAYENV
jgi:hypothetical protein